MITYVHLEDFLTKCEEGLQLVAEAYKVTLEEEALVANNKRRQEEQTIAIEAQILTLKQLMDSYNNPSMSELPFGGDEVEELFDKRLEGRNGESREETQKFREEVYLRESMDVIEEMDALNEATKEVLPGEDPEVSS